MNEILKSVSNWTICLQIANMIKENGGRAVVVGGFVRDLFLTSNEKPEIILNKKPDINNDIDMEVFGLKMGFVENILKKKFRIIRVGKHFCVLKLSDFNIDVSVPRIEEKIGEKHTDFKVQEKPSLSFLEAASRRDFTINAISYDPLTGEIIDPFSGINDLKNGILRHVSEKFSEDPLRVLRAMQFLARFEMSIAPETLELCKKLDIKDISRERIFEEFKKLIVFGKKPSFGLNFLLESGWVKHFPELFATVGCKQEPKNHPEGDVWTHSLLALDFFAKTYESYFDKQICKFYSEQLNSESDSEKKYSKPEQELLKSYFKKTKDEIKYFNNFAEEYEWNRLVIGFAVLCHDFGKPIVSFVQEGVIRSFGHETAGIEPTQKFLHRMTDHKKLVRQVSDLVRMHMYPPYLYFGQAGDSAIRRFLKKVQDIDSLLFIVECDMAGKLSSGECITTWIKSRINSLPKNIDKPIILGRHLIEFGIPPGKNFKNILDYCFNAQMEGKFSNLKEGLEFLSKYINSIK